MFIPYATALSEDEVEGIYSRIVTVIRSITPTARYAHLHVNFRFADSQTGPYFYVANLYDSECEEVDTKDYDPSTRYDREDGIRGLADSGLTKSIYALGISDEQILQWDGCPFGLDLADGQSFEFDPGYIAPSVPYK